MLAIVAVVVEADFCMNFNDNTLSTYCKFGCCGVKLNECCNNDDYYNELTAGAIAGVVIASLVGLAVVIGGVLLVVFLVNSNCCHEQGNQGVVFSTGACANPPSVNIRGQSTLTNTQTTYQYPQQSTKVYNAGYGYI
ncbi:uncharacterized protein LOC110456726 isoform X2 [Mizuhopecten yessoensis]|uniref:Cysteine and tyrosine-rich protein 1 n=1 Tax=Mizuhopecten yessoensis TaxID=6573 RepID=A0A210QAD3_MIZYE|nr:uncharacterized protein LOC110456726 isoform X2 [Mizuhopecten yessoensis]OWF45692.1 hypothetical protein KP79_PYT11600 [Mizuhopecten yessoensis]